MRWKEDLLVVLLAILVATVLLGLGPRNFVSAQTSCDIDCLSGKVTALTSRVVALERIVGVGKTVAANKNTVVKETFKNIGGGTAVGTDWTKVEASDFYFDQSLYGNVEYVTWQGWMDNGYGSVRLYDNTNGRAVDGSTVSLKSDTKSSFYSGNLAIWRGQNQYYIQVKSDTGGAVTISSPRLRIVSK